MKSKVLVLVFSMSGVRHTRHRLLVSVCFDINIGS